MPLVCTGGVNVRLRENAIELRFLFQVFEVGRERFCLPVYAPTTSRKTFADERDHLAPKHGEELIEQLLASLEVIVKTTRRELRLSGNSRHRSFRIANRPHNLRGSAHYPLPRL